MLRAHEGFHTCISECPVEPSLSSKTLSGTSVRFGGMPELCRTGHRAVCWNWHNRWKCQQMPFVVLWCLSNNSSSTARSYVPTASTSPPGHPNPVPSISTTKSCTADAHDACNNNHEGANGRLYACTCWSIRGIYAGHLSRHVNLSSLDQVGPRCTALALPRR